MSVRLRRRWSVEEKQRIVAQTKVPGSSVSEVARRYDVNANMVFKWLRDARFNSAVDGEPEAVSFLPVEVSAGSVISEREASSVGSAGRIEIRLTNGCRLEISGAFDADAVIRLARGLCP